MRPFQVALKHLFENLDVLIDLLSWRLKTCPLRLTFHLTGKFLFKLP